MVKRVSVYNASRAWCALTLDSLLAPSSLSQGVPRYRVCGSKCRQLLADVYGSRIMNHKSIVVHQLRRFYPKQHIHISSLSSQNNLVKYHTFASFQHSLGFHLLGGVKRSSIILPGFEFWDLAASRRVRLAFRTGYQVSSRARFLLFELKGRRVMPGWHFQRCLREGVMEDGNDDPVMRHGSMYWW